MHTEWNTLVAQAGWTMQELRHPLACVYIADVSVVVERSVLALSPNASRHQLTSVLTQAPAWIQPQWLRSGWPNRAIRSEADLEVYAATLFKALLAVGAAIPDGTAEEMTNGLETLFPRLRLARKIGAESYELWRATVLITRAGELQWGYSGPVVRAGLAWPVSDKDIGERSAWEVYLQNMLRIDLQAKLEGAEAPSE